MTTSTLNCLIDGFDKSLKALGKDVAMHEIEQLAVTVHRAMDHPRRAYHCSRHVLEVAKVGTPLGVLAAMFHDVVYVQLDGGFPGGQALLLQPFIKRRDADFVLALGELAASDVRLCAAVFGFVDGQTLPLFGGLNEFASALVACAKLRPYLSSQELFVIAACIEATIPFRAPDTAGRTMPELLRARLDVVNAKFALGYDASGLDEVLCEAIRVANQDVFGFAEKDPGAFLSNTWLLMEESNASLAAVGLYTIQDYRSAMLRMATFLSVLKPEFIFHHYAGIPELDVFQAETEAAKHNVEFSVRYLVTKLTAIAIVEAIALETGGDCPVSMLLGHIHRSTENPVQIEDYLTQPPAQGDVDSRLLAVLEGGRKEHSAHDLTTSPLTAFVYRHLGEAGVANLFALAKQMFDNELAPHAFLSAVKPELREGILDGCTQISLSRRDAIKHLSF